MVRCLSCVFFLVLSTGLLGGPAGHASTLPQVSSPPSADTDSTAPPVVQKFLIKGTLEAQLRDYEEAILYFENALDQAPKTPPLLQALADAHAAQDDFATALFYARKARRHAPDQTYYHRRVAELQREAGQRQDAVSTYQALLQRFPDAHTAYQNLAELQLALDRPQAALDTYKTLLDRGAHSPASIHRKMLPLYRRTGNVEGLEKTLRTLIISHRPNIPRYKRLLGDHYANDGRLDAALDLLVPLAEHYPEDADLQRKVERLAQKTGRTIAQRSPVPPADSTDLSSFSVKQLVRRARTFLDQSPSDTTALRIADQFLQRALDRSPRHVPALCLRARLYERQGEYAEAGRLLKQAVEENPRAPELWGRAARLHLRGHAYESAASVAEEGLLLFPGDTALIRSAAFAQLRAGAPDQARDHFENGLVLQKSDSSSTRETAVLQAGLALAFTYLDRDEDADAALQKALATAPNHPIVLHTCAYSLALRREQLDRALELSRRAVDRAPSSALALDTLGWVYFQRDAFKAARRVLQRALDAGPSSRRILEHFGDMQDALGNDAAARRYWQKALDRAPDRSSLRKKLENASAS